MISSMESVWGNRRREELWGTPTLKDWIEAERKRGQEKQ